MNFTHLISSIEQTHAHFQQQAVKAVNVSLTLRNWLIGLYIVEFELNGEDRALYGNLLFDELAVRLKTIKGIDRRSLYRFKDFYIFYPHIADFIQSNGPAIFLNDPFSPAGGMKALPPIIGLQKVGTASPQSDHKMKVPAQKLVQSLSYSHIEQLLQLDNALQRTFYEIECIKGTWSVRELKRQINSLYFERSGMGAKPERLRKSTQKKAVPTPAVQLIKSVYAFEFLGLNAKNAVEETDLETALLDHLQEFMLEMGHGFCLEARQKKILIGDEYFFVDLVFYHRILKCHVLVELKVEDFNHHNIGQLNTYVNYYKAEVMPPDDNPTIGILLVTRKNNALAEYATAGMDNQLFVSKYLLELPGKEKLESFIQKELEAWN